FARTFSAPLAQVLITGLGWRGAYLAQAGFMAAAVLPLAALFRGAEPAPPAATQAAATASWTLKRAIRTPHFWLLFLVYVFIGLTWGARGPSITAKTADLFPGPQLGTILGAITMGTGVGSALGSWLAGFSFDVTGSYRVAFTLSIIFYACGSVAFWRLRRPA